MSTSAQILNLVSGITPSLLFNTFIHLIYMRKLSSFRVLAKRLFDYKPATEVLAMDSMPHNEASVVRKRRQLYGISTFHYKAVKHVFPYRDCKTSGAVSRRRVGLNRDATHAPATPAGVQYLPRSGNKNDCFAVYSLFDAV